ncbi:MAG: MFS transporter [Acetobacteraceae bacterium]|nr:MFS transporter [Acetobacteraceae bacterium]
MSDHPSVAVMPLPPAVVRRAVVASILGNGMEWYDFLIYGFFATSIAHSFFPAERASVSLMLTLATFAVGFVVRPLGGVLIGIYADHAGRKPALAMLILLMAGGTLLTGLTPSYDSIGLAAPLLVIFARVLQGLSVGGEFASATAMLVEYVPPERKLFFGSFQMCAQAAGVTCAAFAAYAIDQALPPEIVQSWGWRLPFLAGALIGPVGFYIRHRVDDSPEFRQLAPDARDRTPFRGVLRHHLTAVLSAMGLIVAGTAATYLWNTYLPLYVTHQLHLPMAAALFGIGICGLLNIVLYPLAGWLADRVGGYRVFFTALVLFGLMSWPLFAFVNKAPTRANLMGAQLVANVLMAFMAGPTPAMIARLFPTSVRSTGMAVAYNVGVTVFGGLSPLTVTWLIGLTGNRMVPAWYLMAAALLSLAMVLGTQRAWLRRAVPVAAE